MVFFLAQQFPADLAVPSGLLQTGWSHRSSTGPTRWTRPPRPSATPDKDTLRGKAVITVWLGRL